MSVALVEHRRLERHVVYRIHMPDWERRSLIIGRQRHLNDVVDLFYLGFLFLAHLFHGVCVARKGKHVGLDLKLSSIRSLLLLVTHHGDGPDTALLRHAYKVDVAAEHGRLLSGDVFGTFCYYIQIIVLLDLDGAYKVTLDSRSDLRNTVFIERLAM